MDAETVERIALTEDLPTAKQAIRSIEERRDRETLVRVVEEVPVVDLKVEAIKALGEVGTEREARLLLERLEPINATITVGGSEQQVERRQLKEALVGAIARIGDVPPPEDLNEETVSRFVSDARRRMRA